MSRKPPALAVAVVEDDAGVRLSLVKILRQTEKVACVGDYGSGEEAVAGLTLRPADVVLMDINLPGMNGVECVRQLAGLLPEAQIIMLTVYKDTETIFQALASGASGYLLKPVRAQQLIDAVRDVAQGGAPMSSSIARQVVAAFRRRPDVSAGADEASALSERERQVLKLLAEGFLYKQASVELGVSINTFYEHIRRIYRKLHVHSRQEAVAHYRSRA
ncbi:MAG: response regulator transcription factor [bacterium]